MSYQPFYQLTNPEVDALLSKIILESENFEFLPESFMAVTLIPSLKNLNSKLVASTEHVKVKSELEEADAELDKATRCVINLSEGFSEFPEETIANSAKLINRIVGQHGMSLIHFNYSKQWSYTTAILDDLSQPTLQEALANIPLLNTAILEMGNKFNALAEKHANYQYLLSEDNSIVTATEIKRESLRMLRKDFIPYLDLMARTQGGIYEAFNRVVKQLVNNANAIVKGRMTRSKEEETPGERKDK